MTNDKKDILMSKKLKIKILPKDQNALLIFKKKKFYKTLKSAFEVKKHIERKSQKVL